MGGKTKQAQRTKNNSRPSNSGRSAELLGASVPTFIGFTGQNDFGIVQLTPGFSAIESLPDTFDANIGAQYQIVLRKMSKKDPVTKVKALQEFTELISESQIDVIKAILPLWPKFYHNLANDVEHRVRESAQQAQNVVVTKAGKNIAPFLKQLAPVWLASQYDNYAPAASIAQESFRTAFSANKIQEVFTFCQNDILDYIIKNLTFHTSTTLNSAKTNSPEEAENKYQRIVVCSLHTYALYIEKTPSDRVKEAQPKSQVLFDNPKFWNFSKHKTASIRSAWFEMLYSLLQHASYLIENNKQQIISLVFQNMDDNDIVVLPQVWGCILLSQEVFTDWYNFANFKKVIQPKMFALLKSKANGNASAVYTHFLPFISKLTTERIQNYPIENFYNDFFEHIKNSLIIPSENVTSRQDITSIVNTLYECLRYVIKQKSLESSENFDSINSYCHNLLEKFIINLIRWSLGSETVTSRNIFGNISTLIVYWAQNSNSSKLYENLLNSFWMQLSRIITEYPETITEENVPIHSKKIVELIQNLNNASPNSPDNKVKFSLGEKSKTDLSPANNKQSNHILQVNLKKISTKLVQIYLQQINKDNITNYVNQLKTLCQLFGDVDFYSNVSSDKKLISTLNDLMKWLDDGYPTFEPIVDIIFEILFLLEKDQRMDYLNKLLLLSNESVQEWVLQRLLSYPICIEPEIRKILSEKHVSNMIIRITKDVIKENSKEKLNLLHKCFFQTESGEVLIDKFTIEGVVKVMTEPFSNKHMIDMLDTCGSFVAQIMPVICSENATKDLQNFVFLKLFEFSINMVENDNLSEDTLWEITTCWQDALSSNDIRLNDEIIKEISYIVHKRIFDTEDLMVTDLINIAGIVSKLISCSTEKITNENERYKKIDETMNLILYISEDQNNLTLLDDICLYFECLNGIRAVPNLKNTSIGTISDENIVNFFRTHFFNLSVLFKLISKLSCNDNLTQFEENGELNQSTTMRDEDDIENLYESSDCLILTDWSENIFDHILKCIYIDQMGESLIANSFLISEETEAIIFSMTEKIKLLLKHSPEKFVVSLKNQLFNKIKGNATSWARPILSLLSIEQYCKTDTGAVLLYEDATTFLLENNCYQSYANVLQFMLEKLPSKCLPINIDILQSHVDILIREIALHCLIINHFSGNYIELNDKKIIVHCLNLLTEFCARQLSDNTFLLYNQEIHKKDTFSVLTVIELANLLTDVLGNFPTELDIKHWDLIRIGLSSWVLSISKNLKHFKDPKVSIFITSIYKLFGALSKFIAKEKTKSSTEMLTNMIDEWENLFAREINLVLFKSYINLVSEKKENSISSIGLLDAISPQLEYLDYSVIFNACSKNFKISLDDVIKFSLNNLSNSVHSVRVACASIIQKLTDFFVALDVENVEKRNDLIDRNNENSSASEEWHFLHKFAENLIKYSAIVENYLTDFSFKITEIPDLQSINRSDTLPILLLWDCIILAFSKAPAELRSFYATWITENQFEKTILHLLFRLMPVEILKNYDSKVMNNDMFKCLYWEQIKDRNISTERYSCHIYAQMLRHLPAVVRKWWNASNPRQKTFVDKLTTNFVSNLICQEELRAIIAKKEKHENMQVTVHNSTREVIAAYSIDEARMELVISLASNHPLGSVKVESGKQIGGRLQSRVVVMQLTIFLTHQNGSIFDGLTLWKKNLDKKFEGVEECYVCYSVIHQDTCQLPKLSCRTCRKKFHGPCLYKWFTTSSKSTCPICRNVF